MANVNSFDPVAVSIDGGRHRGELWRNLAYAATNGAEGVIAPGDCKPRQLATAGPQIRLDSGAVAIRVRSANIDNQTYIANNRAETRLDIAATGGTKRSDLIVVRVKDPEYSPWPTPASLGQDPATYQYVEPFVIQNVPETTTHFTQLNLGYSAYALARVDVPANTTNITTEMIKGLRKVAVQRRETFFARLDMPLGSSDLSNTTGTTTWDKYPTQITDQPMACPDFATKAIIRVHVTGIAQLTGAYKGNWRYRLSDGAGTVAPTKVTYMNEQDAASTRATYMISDMVDVPDVFRGKTITGFLEFQRTGGVGRLKADQDTQVSIEVTWVGAAI